MALHNDLGKKGELLAADFLIRKGYEILDENWVFGKAEVDLIVYLDHVIIFVEVKSRSSTNFGFPEDFVDSSKQQLMVDAADAYIDLMNHTGEIRFDIIAVLFDKQQNYTLNHIEDAFWPV